MKQIEKLQAKARQRFGFCGSLIIHFILFVALAFSGVFAMQAPAADADTVVFFDAGGGGGGGGDEAVADAADYGEEQVEEVVEEETITLPDGKIEHKQVVKHVVKHVPAGAKKGSGGGRVVVRGVVGIDGRGDGGRRYRRLLAGNRRHGRMQLLHQKSHNQRALRRYCGTLRFRCARQP